MKIRTAGEEDLADLLRLMRSYCDFYGASPSDDSLLAMSRCLQREPREGVQLLACDEENSVVGFATIFWTWSTLSGSRIGIMNDLFVSPEARGSGAADALIAACAERCRGRGATVLAWQTAKDNYRAQAVYERVGATREEWLDYSFEV
jgi:GNAT superfamily N-acetyltransferase